MADTIEQQADNAVGRANRMVKALIIGPEPVAAPADASRSLAEEELFQKYANRIVPPPYNLTVLARFPELSGELGQVIEAMEANIEGFGYRLVARVPLEGEVPDKLKKVVEAERIRLENFFAGVAIRGSFTALRRNLRSDVESTGNGYVEVIRNLKGEIANLKHLPAYQMRLGVQDAKFVTVTVPRLQVTDNGDFAIEQLPQHRRFRRYVQGQVLLLAHRGGAIREVESQALGKVRWFKEWGDPRTVDAATGEVVDDKEIATFNNGKPMREPQKASEVIHFRIYSPRTPYGIPRYIGNLTSILGERKAGEVNLATITNNNVPSMAVTVSDGMLTDATIKRINQFAEILQGDDNRSRFLLIEGESAVEGEEAGHVKVAITPLTDVQLKDALFQNYVKQCKDAIRRSFRLPPIFVGASDEYNRATAEASRKLADEQVFGPERDEVDWTVNNMILADLGIRYWRFESRTPNVTDNRELVQMLAAAERTGGITPRISRQVIEDVFKEASDAPAIDPNKLDPDQPFSLTMAEAVKNTGGPAGPTEIGQTIAPVQPSGQVAKAHRNATIVDLLDLGNRASEEILRAVRTVGSVEGDD
jgi:PBSX family phage portal protein